MDLTNDDVLKILSIVDESGYNDVYLEIGDFKLHVQKQGSASHDVPHTLIDSHRTKPDVVPNAAQLPPPSTRPEPPVMPAASKVEPVPEGAVGVTAPILGTFYRSAAPGEKAFVEVGSKVGVNDTLCLIEVMKLFNAVKAGVAGTVVKILAENGSMVEHGQVLVYIQPEA
jgi:acetyl-CoA carboxylase biotin carboxyl carrier protein